MRWPANSARSGTPASSVFSSASVFSPTSPSPSVVRSSSRVVDDDDLAVGGQMDVKLDGVYAQLDRPLERRERVLRRVAHRAAMPEDARAGRSDRMLPHETPPPAPSPVRGEGRSDRPAPPLRARGRGLGGGALAQPSTRRTTPTIRSSRSSRRSGRPLRDISWLSSGNRTNSAVFPRRRSETNHCSACSMRAAQVLLAVEDQDRRGHLLDVRQRRKLPVPLDLVARRACQLALAEPRPDVAGAVERDEVGEAAHRDRRLEAVGVPDDPVRHVAAVAAAGHPEPRRRPRPAAGRSGRRPPSSPGSPGCPSRPAISEQNRSPYPLLPRGLV